MSQVNTWVVLVGSPDIITGALLPSLSLLSVCLCTIHQRFNTQFFTGLTHSSLTVHTHYWLYSPFIGTTSFISTGLVFTALVCIYTFQQPCNNLHLSYMCIQTLFSHPTYIKCSINQPYVCVIAHSSLIGLT